MMFIYYQTSALVLDEGIIPQDSHILPPFSPNNCRSFCGALPFPGTVDGGKWSLCGHVSSLYLWGDSGRSFLLLADNAGRSSWSASLAQRPLCSPRHLSEDLIIHEHLKSFQFIKHLSSNSHDESVKNTVLTLFYKSQQTARRFFYLKALHQSWREQKHSLTFAVCLDRINEERWYRHTLFAQRNCTCVCLRRWLSIEMHCESNMVKVCLTLPTWSF